MKKAAGYFFLIAPYMGYNVDVHQASAQLPLRFDFRLPTLGRSAEPGHMAHCGARCEINSPKWYWRPALKL